MPIRALPRLTMSEEMEAEGQRPVRWRMVPLVLVVVMLVGSLLVPARETWRIMSLLREINEVIEPTRLQGARLELGLRAESAALENFMLSGDRAELDGYLATAADNDRQLATIDSLAQVLDPAAADRVAAVRGRIGDWRKASRGLVEGRLPPARLTAAMRIEKARYQSVLGEVNRLGALLAAEGSARREVIRGSERLGLLANASLVFVALAAVVAVGALSARERRLAAALRRRVEEETAIRLVALTLDAAETTEDVMRHIAEGATATAHVSGSYVECIAADRDAVEFVVHDRGRLSSLCTHAPIAGSLTETIMARGSAGSLMEVDSVARWIAPDPARDVAPRAGLVAPLSSSGRMFGVLLLLSNDGRSRFGEAARRQIQTLADLASAALQRVAIRAAERRALEEAERRARQEAALLEASEALAAAFTVDAVTQQIARTALEAMQAQGAFVERIDSAPTEQGKAIVVRASTGHGVPALGSVAPYEGSRTEQALESGEPVCIPGLANGDESSTGSAAAGAACPTIAVRLGSAVAPFGALFIVNSAETAFDPDDITRARTFGSLAALAYEKVRLLDEAREGRQALARMMRSRSRLMRGFSHDVKNPLGAADGYAALLSDGIYGPLTVPQADGIRRIQASIHAALSLIDDLHELARAETGHIALDLVCVDLRDVVRASGDEYRAAAEVSGLSLITDAEPAPVMVETDRVRVRQIVGNLLSNVIKYTARGSVTLRARWWPPDGAPESGDWGLIDVSDTGRGIPADKQHAIFEEFTRIGSNDASGAGLGLAISQKLSQALGGSITLKSEVGRGSTFTLWLPLRGRMKEPSAKPPLQERL